MPIDDKATKEIIFAAAARLFADKGFNGVSMREISEQSNVSKPTIYYYFGSKEGIYHQLVDTGIAHIYAILEETSRLPISAKEKLIYLTKRIFIQTREHPDYIKFFLNMSVVSGDSLLLEKCRKQAVENDNIFVEIIRGGVKSGEFGAGADPELAADIVGGVLQHFIWKQLASKEYILSDQLAENIIELIFKGLNE